MLNDLEHPEITRCLRTGYPSRMNPEEEDFDQGAYEAYCDHIYEEQREKMLFGD